MKKIVKMFKLLIPYPSSLLFFMATLLSILLVQNRHNWVGRFDWLAIIYISVAVISFGISVHLYREKI